MSRRSPFCLAALPLLLLATAAAPARAHEATEMAATTGVRAEMLMWINDAQDKLIQLAEITPEAKYAWRPNKDVRSVGEVFMHVATANFGAPSFWGKMPPAGFNFDTYEKSLTKKADIIKAMKDSFAHMEAGFAAVPDSDLDKPVELFGGLVKTSVRGGYMLLLSHAHEHLGQSIAYARSNGIAPPWTAKQQAAIKEMQDKMKSGGK